jgi:hypothetical protein
MDPETRAVIWTSSKASTLPTAVTWYWTLVEGTGATSTGKGFFRSGPPRFCWAEEE